MDGLPAILSTDSVPVSYRKPFWADLVCGRSITAIAYEWGFKDSAHFSRAFRRRFNCSPRELRADAIRSPAE